MPAPIKRHTALQPLSRDHHQGLLLCWKIRAGLAKGIALDRIRQYAAFMFETQIGPHFEIEEQYVFPVLGAEHPLVQQALEQHAKLRLLFRDGNNAESSLNSLQQELEHHIRFEERVLFSEIQEKATPAQLQVIETHHPEAPATEEWADEFWK